MSNLASILAIAAHLVAFNNGVCYQACRSEGYHTGKFVQVKKTAYCDCTYRMLMEDLTARPFTLTMKPSGATQTNTTQDNTNYKFDLFNGFYGED